MKPTLRSVFTALVLSLALGTRAAPSLSIDFNRRNADPSTNTMAGFSSFIISSNIANNAIQTQATTRVFGSISVTVSNNLPNGYDDRLRGNVPANTATFTESLLLRDRKFPYRAQQMGRNDPRATRLRCRSRPVLPGRRRRIRIE